MEFDRDLHKLVTMSERTARGVEAIAESLEKMASAPPLEMVEPSPLFCPHCGTVNPEIQILSDEGKGKSSEFLLMAQCLTCHKTIYGIPMGWSVFSTADEVRSVTGGNGNPNG
jgi:hypothetical protein